MEELAKGLGRGGADELGKGRVLGSVALVVLPAGGDDLGAEGQAHCEEGADEEGGDGVLADGLLLLLLRGLGRGRQLIGMLLIVAQEPGLQAVVSRGFHCCGAPWDKVGWVWGDERRERRALGCRRR